MNKSKNSLQHQLYDLWENLDESRNKIDEKVNIKRRGNHRTTKCYVPSLLPAVVVPDEGASYNPPLDSYLEFVNKAAIKEKKVEVNERYIVNKIEPSKFELCTIQGLKRDNLFFIEEDSTNKQMNIEVEEEEIKPEDRKIKIEGKKKKTIQQRRKQKRILERQKFKTGTEQQKKQQRQQLESLKSLNRMVSAEAEMHEAKMKERRMWRTMKKLTKKKRLGRGKFEANMDPVLVPSEMPSSLRQMPAPSTGGILEERFKSFQRRNIVPIPGERNQNKLKNRLRAKFVEKRSVKEVTLTSKVI